jgi:carbonic anhydrase
MNRDDLESLLGLIRDRTGSRRDAGYESDARTALVVSCSMSDCKPRGPLWPIDATWNVLRVRTLGNQTGERREGKTVLDGSVEHLRTNHDVTAILVVGHTSCGVLEDAYERWIAPDPESPPGIEARLDPLRSIVGDGFERGLLAESLPIRTVQHRLVEYNVRRQVRVLRRALPPSVTVAGYVYDQDGAYSPFPDGRYLVAFDGATDPATIRARLPEDTSVRVASVLV